MSLILYNCTIHGNNKASAVLIEGEFIKHVGSMNECRSIAKNRTLVIDLKGKYLLPGFIDAHTHFVELSKFKIDVNLLGTRSIDEINEYLIKYRANMKKGISWVLGGGWDRNNYTNPSLLNRHTLDKVFPDIPVALFSKDYHSKLCNSLALRIAGIDESTQTPNGGLIERDENGYPTGILFETATELIDRHIVQASDYVTEKAIQLTIDDFYQYGLVAFHTMEDERACRLLLRLQEKGSKFRFCWHFQVHELDKMIDSHEVSYGNNEWFKIGGVKLFGDGSLGSRTAAMFNPYSNEPENYGILRYSNDEILALIKKADRAGLSSTIHAIGDKCVHQVASTILKLKPSEVTSPMHRIEHVQSIRPQDIEIVKKAKLLVSLQPVHLANDIPMIEMYWSDIKEEAYAYNSLIESGIPYAFGSDAPIESFNPFWGIYTAAQRKQGLKTNAASWCPKQLISLDQAIFGYTQGAAQASISQHIRGAIVPGYLADLCVVENPYNNELDYLLYARSLMTIVSGEIVYSAIDV